MTVWLVLSLLTIAACACIAIPILKGGERPFASSLEPAQQALSSTLSAINRDAESGRLDEDEAQAQRAEIARRFLELKRDESQSGPQTSATGARAGQIIAGIAVLCIPLLSFTLYGKLGAPEYADQPLAPRIFGENAKDIMRMTREVEAKLVANPKDGDGWRVIAPIYRQMGRLGDAADAYARAFSFGQFSDDIKAQLLADRAEVLLMQSDGAFSPNIRATINMGVNLAPNNARLAFLNAMAVDQSGDRQSSIAAWSALIERFSTGGDAAFVQMARQRLDALEAGGPPLPSAAGATAERGPTREDVEAAQEMSETDRQAMIEGMVANLAARLDENPDDLAGWERLIRAYAVMGRRAESVSALSKARAAFINSPQAQSRLDELDRQLNAQE